MGQNEEAPVWRPRLSWSGRRDSNPGDPTEKHEETGEVSAPSIAAFTDESTGETTFVEAVIDPTDSDGTRPPEPIDVAPSERLDAVAFRLAASIDRAMAAEQWALANRLAATLDKLVGGLEPLTVTRRDAASSAPAGVDRRGAEVIGLRTRG